MYKIFHTLPFDAFLSCHDPEDEEGKMKRLSLCFCLCIPHVLRPDLTVTHPTKQNVPP